MLATESLKGLFDTYGRHARLFPGLLTIFPILLAVLAWFPALLTSSIGGTLLTLAMSCGLLYAIGSWARTRGKRIEPRLLSEWGGWPTTLLLRHTGRLDSVTRMRYHSFLGEQVPGLVMPTRDYELREPAQADETYVSAIKWLKERARLASFPMIERENAQYGFRRNLLGLRPVGLWSCILTVLASMAAIILKTDGALDALIVQEWRIALSSIGSISTAIWAAIAVNLIALVAWMRIVNEAWVREAAEQYAEALLAACDQLMQPIAAKAQRGAPRVRVVE